MFFIGGIAAFCPAAGLGGYPPAYTALVCRNFRHNIQAKYQIKGGGASTSRTASLRFKLSGGLTLNENTTRDNILSDPASTVCRSDFSD